jgi:4-hydroxy-tetrahydrodipicolinate reductase
MLKIYVNGLSGKMGSSLLNQVSHMENISIVEAISDCEVVIDFSRPESSLEIVKKCLDNKKPIVIGTTGFNNDQIQIVKEAARDIPVLLSYNMSRGIYSLKKSIKDFLSKNKDMYECIIFEVHHKEKTDLPSGTAIELKETIENHDKGNFVSSIKIESERISNINGIHKIKFYNAKDLVTFKHEALSRNIFSDGAIAIAQSIINKEPNLYSTKDFFN